MGETAQERPPRRRPDRRPGRARPGDALLAHVLALGPGWRKRTGGTSRRDAAALTQLATTGLDGLDGYFTSYLPALIGAVAIPLAVLVAITVADPVSGIIVACTLPLGSSAP